MNVRTNFFSTRCRKILAKYLGFFFLTCNFSVKKYIKILTFRFDLLGIFLLPRRPVKTQTAANHIKISVQKMVNFISDIELSLCTILYHRVIYMDFIFGLGITLQEFFLYKDSKNHQSILITLYIQNKQSTLDSNSRTEFPIPAQCDSVSH